MVKCHLTPSYFHLFGPLKEALRGRSSCDDGDDDVKAVLDQPKMFFADGIEK